MASDREPGAYWVTWRLRDGGFEPPVLMSWDGNSRWWFFGSDDSSPDDGILVLSDRLEPPPTFKGVPIAVTIFKPYEKPPKPPVGCMPEREG